MSENRDSLAEMVFSEPDRPVIGPISTPEWPSVDGKLFVRGLTGDQRDRYETALARYADKKHGMLKANTTGIRAGMVAAGACNADGDPIFSPTDAQRLGEKSAVVLDRLFDAIRRASGMDMGDLEKNSAETTGDGSS